MTLDTRSMAIGAGLLLLVGVGVGYVVRGNNQSSSPSPETITTTQSAGPEKGSSEWKIQNAASAAVPAVSKDATILDWPEKEGAQPTELRKGINEWTCLPDYPGSPGNDPICADTSAMQWFAAYMAHKEPKLTQVGLAYMLQGASDASNTDPFATEPAAGQDWVTAPAHVMVFPVGKLDPKLYGTDDKSGKSWIMYVGTPYEHLMIPVQ